MIMVIILKSNYINAKQVLMYDHLINGQLVQTNALIDCIIIYNCSYYVIGLLVLNILRFTCAI